MLLLPKSLLQRCFHSFRTSRYSTVGLNLWDQDISSEIKHKLESHWRQQIEHKPFDESDKSSDKYYVLSMFPYPSGSLHMGHVRVYTISDAVARHQRMRGKNVIHPMGWDAFGLPAENAAIERNIAPDVWTRRNIAHMRKQLIELGCSFDWDRELATCDPGYYKWTQDLFLKLFDAGLVYQCEAMVNWDPVDQTVLADEQVDEDGKSWRSGAKVEKRLLKQWFVRTTAFAKDLLEGLDSPVLEDWRDIVKLQQHWIGVCDGVRFDFKVSDCDDDRFVTLWTSKPEYLEHAKFVCLSSEHLMAKREGVSGARGTVKLGVELENPLTGEALPVFVTDELEFLPLTDSYLGIPDVFEEATNFAQTHNIPFRTVPQFVNENETQQKQSEICEKAKTLKIGGYWTSAKLRDWLISRQRYWGTPIPIVHCEKCGVQPVPRDNLPVVLPESEGLSEKGGSSLSALTEWVNTTCPKCGSEARRETDTMDTFVDSSWYFLRYLDPNNDAEMFGRDKAKFGTPVDLYVGGKEHAVLHLYYARFVNHFLHSLGLLPEREPFRKLLVQGMVKGRSYRLKGTGEYLPESKVKVIDLKKNKAETKDTGQPVVTIWEKMSKSKYNRVDPEDMFKEYGIDTTRLLILADVAPTSHRHWNSDTFPGVLNWQNRLWLTIRDFLHSRQNLPPMLPQTEFDAHDDYLYDSRNFYVKGVTFNYLVTQQLSIAVSKLQGLTNSLRKVPPAIRAHSPQYERALAVQIIMLAPMAPSFASELWSGFVSAPNRLNPTGEIAWDRPVFGQKWPETDAEYKLDLVCQLNKTEIVTIKVPRIELDVLTKEQAVSMALQQKLVQERLVKWKMHDSKYVLYPGMEAVVSISTVRKEAEERQATTDLDSVFV